MRIGLAVLLVVLAGSAGCADEPARAPRVPGPETVVWAVGDGADGSAAGRRLARSVARRHPDRFLYVGDVYGRGTAADFRRHYAPLYAALAGRTDPVVGNHEYANRRSGYEPYWRDARGWSPGATRHRAYVDRSGWQILAYSSEADPASEAAWVGRQVAAHPGTCRLALGHRGRYVVADTLEPDNADQRPIWSQLAGRTAINLVGHDHLYGRLAPIDGVTVLVSGAGGHELRRLGRQRHAVAAVKTGVPTATRFVLRPGAADFRQVDATGKVYDEGTIACAATG